MVLSYTFHGHVTKKITAKNFKFKQGMKISL